MINVGVEKKESKLAVELSEKYSKGVYAIVGHHPTSEEEFDKDFYRKLQKIKKVVGIGECGLDFFRDRSEVAAKSRKSFFAAR